MTTTLPPADAILALPPGPELDALILEHVLGWVWAKSLFLPYRGLFEPSEHLPASGPEVASLPLDPWHCDSEGAWPQPSRNWGDAGRVLDWFEGNRAGSFSLGPLYDGGWVAMCDDGLEVADADSGPAALCRLALLVVARERQGKEVRGA